MKTVPVTYAGRTVALPDLADYAKFYAKLRAGLWEPRTFAALKRNLNADTVHVDIGAWIGVTPFWAAGIAKAVIAVEPDPQCAGILRRLGRDYPTFTLLEGALAAENAVTINSVGGFGSSETSVLEIGDGDCKVVQGLTVEDIMRHAGGAQCFLKIDIEGYEYRLVPMLSRLNNYPLRAVQIAVHPQLYEKSLSGPLFLRRLRTAWHTLRLGRLFAGTLGKASISGFESLRTYIMYGVLLRSRPKGADFLFERMPG